MPNGDPTKTHKIEGGTFAAGLYYNNGEITGGAFNGKDSIFTNGTVLSGNYRSVTVKDGTISKVNDTLPLVPNETGTDWVQSSAWNLYSYADTVLTVESNVDITNINGQEIGKAFSSIYPNGETDKTVVRFEMPDSDVELNSTKIVVPDPKPEPQTRARTRSPHLHPDGEGRHVHLQRRRSHDQRQRAGGCRGQGDAEPERRARGHGVRPVGHG